MMLFSGVWLFETPWTAAHQPSLCFTISQSLLKFMSIEWMMLSNHLILCRPLLLCLQSFLAWVGSSHQVAKVLERQVQHQSSHWLFRVDFLPDWLAWSPCKFTRNVIFKSRWLALLPVSLALSHWVSSGYGYTTFSWSFCIQRCLPTNRGFPPPV